MPKLHPEKQILGFDFGSKHIGVAIGQLITHTASALDTISAKDGIPNWCEIKKLCQTYDVQAFVVGIPLNMDGTKQAITLLAEKFCQELAQRFSLPVYRCDERLTTRSARTELFDQGGYRALTKDAIDCYSAKIILEHWLRRQQDGNLSASD